MYRVARLEENIKLYSMAFCQDFKNEFCRKKILFRDCNHCNMYRSQVRVSLNCLLDCQAAWNPLFRLLYVALHSENQLLKCHKRTPDL